MIDKNKNIIGNLEQAGMSRRGFLHGMGGAGAFLGMAGMASNAAAAPKSMSLKRRPIK